MKSANPVTLDELIGDYLERIDAGQQPDPHEFVAHWPQHRHAFLEFLAQSDWISRLTAAEGSSDDPSAQDADTPGLVRQVVGGYRIVRQIGRGGMSRVFEAERLADGAQVALKVMDTGIIADRSVEQRFRREAQAIQSLQHPHIVPLLDVGYDEGVSYLALQLIRGWTLANLIHALRESNSRLENRDGGAPDVLSILIQPSSNPGGGHTQLDYAAELAEKIANVADALQAAHDQGIVHRDVKPSNLMLAEDGTIWLTDFGLASVGDAHTALTHTGQVVGTPCYMSPEQARGDSRGIGPASDIYSLGATLYELVTLIRPYRGERLRVLLELSAGRLKPPSKVYPQIPKALEAIILKAMAFQPADRYATAADMGRDLRRFVAGQSTVAKLPGATDRLFRWIAAHPRQTLAASCGVLVAGLLLVAVQHVMGRRLSGLNRQLEDRNAVIESSNKQLTASNLALDRSQSRLLRQLYVADIAAAYRAYAQRDIDAVQQLLARHAPGQTAVSEMGPDQRGFEWWLLRNLTQPPSQQTLGWHTNEARELALLPAGQGLLSVGHDGVVRRWGLASDSEPVPFILGDKLDCIAITADGRRMLVGQNVPEGVNPVTVRCTGTGRVLQDLNGHEFAVESASISRSGKWLATAGRYHEVLLHDSEGNLHARVQTGSRNEALAFSADERQLFAVVREDDEWQRQHFLARYEVPSLKFVNYVPLPIDPKVFCLSADGRSLLVANQDALTLVDPSDDRLLVAPTDVRGRVRCVALTRDGSSLAAGCDNGLLYVWHHPVLDPHQTMVPTHVINSGPQGVSSVAFDENDHLLATLKDGSVRQWLFTGQAAGWSEFGLPISSIDAPDGQTGTVLGRQVDGSVYRIDLVNRTCEWVAEPAAGHCNALAVSSDGKQIMVSTDREILAVDRRDAAQDVGEPIVDDARSCTWLRFLPGDDEFLVLHHDRLCAYDAADGQLLRQVDLADEGAERLSVAPSGERILVNGRKWLRCFEAESFDMLHDQTAQFSEHTLAEYSPSGEWVVVGHQDGTLELLDGSEFERQTILRGHRSGIDDCVFLPDERTLVTIASGGSLRFWDILSGRELGVLHLEDPASGYRLHFDRLQQSLFIFHPQQPIRVLSGR